jgi:DNA-binding CsgD family transcriptional regulator
VRRLEDLLASVLFDRSLASVDPEAAIALIECTVAFGEDDRAAVLAARLESLAATRPRSSGLAAAAVTARGLVDDATSDERGVVVIEVNCQPDPRRDGAAGPRPGSVTQSRGPVGSARSGRGPHPTFGWSSLTHTERRIADLVADGLTNREAAKEIFVSRHTVDSHLRHIFRKLNIGSRVQLTRLAIEHSPAFTEDLQLDRGSTPGRAQGREAEDR